ncbi:MAG: endonuclease domain-containing protein [Rhodospirillales bacterium]
MGEGAPATDSIPPISKSRALRVAMTDAEKKLWQALRSKQIAGLRFRRQVPFGPYIADFVCYGARVVIEIDGGQHNTDAGRDANGKRDAWFGLSGFIVLRFWNNDVMENLEGVLQRIDSIVRDRASLGQAPPPPNPLPRGEGK